MNVKKSCGRPPGSLVTHSTILILSGFLIGSAAGNLAGPEMTTTVYLAGAFGIAAYFGLRAAAAPGRREVERLTGDLAASRLESRVNRHIPRGLPQRRGRRVHGETGLSPHVPVVVRSRGVRSAVH
ncbi:MAG: hypothetical protein KY476_13440 [Planctomycetes bacterium]|nr:hypothetical protein [Planctomycetota bacterium]